MEPGPARARLSVCSVVSVHCGGRKKMKLSEFWAAMDHEFGPVYARHLARDLVPEDFGDLTA